MAFIRKPLSGESANANDLTLLFGDIFMEGVVTGFTVSSLHGLRIKVSSGKAYVRDSTNGLLLLESDEEYTFDVANSTTSYIYLCADVEEPPVKVSTTNHLSNCFKIATVVASSGAVNITSNKYALNGSFPIGSIVAWHGTIANIPSGWALCDGTNGTPDLRGRCLKSIDTTEDPGTTGGSSTHRHYNISGGWGIASWYVDPYLGYSSSWPPYYEVAFIMRVE